VALALPPLAQLLYFISSGELFSGLISQVFAACAGHLSLQAIFLHTREESDAEQGGIEGCVVWGNYWGSCKLCLDHFVWHQAGEGAPSGDLNQSQTLSSAWPAWHGVAWN